MVEGGLKAGTAVVDALVAVVMSPLRFVLWLVEWARWWGSDSRRRILAVVLLSLGLLAVVGTRTYRLELRYQQTDMSRAEVAETSFLPPPEVLRVLGLGHGTFVADMLFLRANMYFIGHLFSDRIYEWLDLYVESMLALDPDNPRVYEWASQSVKFGQVIGNEALMKSNDYAERGIARFPDHWRFYFDIGFNYHMEWQWESEAEREEVQAKALPYFAMAASLPNAKLDPNFVAELYLRANDVEMALFHAYQQYMQANDQQKRSLRRRIARYQSEAAARQLADADERHRERWGYVPFGLFELIGEQHVVSVPQSWAVESALAATTASND